MRKIFTGSQIRTLDDLTLKEEGISYSDLIERAARVFCNEFLRLYTPQNKQVILFCGPGHNGADGLAIARILNEEGFKTAAYLFNPSGQLSPEIINKRDLYLATEEGRFKEVVDEFAPPALDAHTVVIDALFGTGLNRPLEGGFAAVVKYINQSASEVVSVDIPSGLFSEDNTHNQPDTIIQATYTFTFEFPKLSFFFAENETFVGVLRVLPIDLSAKGKESLSCEYVQVTDTAIGEMLPPISRFVHKGHFGHALIVAGSEGMSGAAILAGRAAMRSGLGKLTLHVPFCARDVLQIALPEAIVEADRHQAILTQSRFHPRYSAIGVGPGIRGEVETVTMLQQLLHSSSKPVVLDADALNILADNPDLWNDVPAKSIITPHAMELQRLTCYCRNDWERFVQARQLARQRGIYVVLKGAFSVTCTPGGMAIFNSTGNSGMATAGSGDVLLGIITSLLAQGYEAITSAVLGVYLHGLAGDIYSGKQSARSLIASDIVDSLPEAFRQYRR